MGKTWLVVEDIPDFDPEHYAVQMLSSCSIENLAAFSFEQINSKVSCLYDVGAFRPLSSLAPSGNLKADALKALINSLIAAMTDMSDHLLEPSDLILEEECVFIGNSSEEWLFIALPGSGKDLPFRPEALFRSLLNLVNYDDRDAVMMVYELNRLTSRGAVSAEDLSGLITGSLGNSPAGSDSFSSLPEYTSGLNPEADSDANNFLTPAREKPLSFMEKTRIYLKGKRLQDVVDDINSGIIVKKIRQAEAPILLEPSSVLEKELPEKEPEGPIRLPDEYRQNADGDM